MAENVLNKTGSSAHKLFRNMMENRFLTKDTAKLSNLHQTYDLKMFHIFAKNFAPKTTHFLNPAVMAR